MDFPGHGGLTVDVFVYVFSKSPFTAIENWQKLETLNLSHNKIKALPGTLCKITALRRLFVNDNQLDFEGIPSGIGKLGNLEVFAAANNQLEMIPEGLCRYNMTSVLCPKSLTNKSFKMWLVKEAELELKSLNNAARRDPFAGRFGLVGLAKQSRLSYAAETERNEQRSRIGVLQHRFLAAKPTTISRRSCASSSSGFKYESQQFNLQIVFYFKPLIDPTKDSIARKMRLRRGKRDQEEADQDQAKILKGMKDIAKEKNKSMEEDLKTEFLK